MIPSKIKIKIWHCVAFMQRYAVMCYAFCIHIEIMGYTGSPRKKDTQISGTVIQKLLNLQKIS